MCITTDRTSACCSHPNWSTDLAPSADPLNLASANEREAERRTARLVRDAESAFLQNVKDLAEGLTALCLLVCGFLDLLGEPLLPGIQPSCRIPT